jgi:hypothetical protein
VRFVVFPVWVFHVKICVLVLRLIYFYLRDFVTSGIRASDFKIDLLPARLSAALPGSTALRCLDQQPQTSGIKQLHLIKAML